MDFLVSASRVASAALIANSTRVGVVTENLANVESAGSTPGSDPYARKRVTFESIRATGGIQHIRARTINGDSDSFRVEHRPGHPAADERGFVKLPSIDPLIEIADLKEANRAYQANLQTIRQIRELVSMTIDLLKG
ncbi:MAG: flagellar basal body rod protein FlgC [Beijerinckiaceae bacterium]|nr:flagellar basal body rod protein FlgC [Beijerinckiaceae bacterium]